VVGLAGFSKLRNVGGFKADGIIKILFSEYEWQTPFRKIVLFIYSISVMRPLFSNNAKGILMTPIVLAL
jgi:hypothetical protein